MLINAAAAPRLSSKRVYLQSVSIGRSIKSLVVLLLLNMDYKYIKYTKYTTFLKIKIRIMEIIHIIKQIFALWLFLDCFLHFECILTFVGLFCTINCIMLLIIYTFQHYLLLWAIQLNLVISLIFVCAGS